MIKRLGRFVDPIVVVLDAAGRKYWTPNGNHRRNRLTKLKAECIPVILIPEPEVAYQILALNTEKAHNLKEKSLEVIRMYRGLVEEALEGHRGGLRLPVRGPALHHARPPLRRAPSLRRWRVRPAAASR